MSVRPRSADAGEVIGAISGQLKGRVLRKPYTLVFTPEYTVLAKRTTALQKEAATKARTEAKAGGGGWFSQIGSQMATHTGFHERYYTMSVDEILAEHEKNQAIPNRDVSSVTVRDSRTDYDDEGGYTIHEARLRLETPAKSYRFDVDTNVLLAEATELLREVYGARVR